MPHTKDADSSLAHNRERLRQQLIQGFTVGQARLKDVGFGTQVVVRQGLDLWLEPINLHHMAAQLLEQAIIATTKDFFK